MVKRCLLCLSIFVLLASCSSNADQANDEKGRAYNIYSMEVSLRENPYQLSIVQELDYYNTLEADLHDFCFNLYPLSLANGEVELLSVKVNQEDVDFDYYATGIRVLLKEVLPPNELVSFQMEYVVTIPEMKSKFGCFNHTINAGNFYFIPAQYNEGWVPTEYSTIGELFSTEIAEYYVKVNAPSHYTIASTGVNIEDNLFYSPAARDFALFFADQYHSYSEIINDVQVCLYYNNEQRERLPNLVKTVREALEFYNVSFGEYPFKNLSVVFTDLESAGGMEYSNFVFLSITPLINELLNEYGEEEIERLIAHEIAHQWFYHILGNDQATEPWLDEAFATYAEILFLREFREHSPAYLNVVHDDVVARYTAGEDASIVHTIYDFNSNLDYRNNIYIEGASFLYQIENIIGKETFLSLLKKYIQEHQLGIITTDSFVKYWLNASDVDLSKLFLIYLDRQ